MLTLPQTLTYYSPPLTRSRRSLKCIKGDSSGPPPDQSLLVQVRTPFPNTHQGSSPEAPFPNMCQGSSPMAPLLNTCQSHLRCTGFYPLYLGAIRGNREGEHQKHGCYLLKEMNPSGTTTAKRKEAKNKQKAKERPILYTSLKILSHQARRHVASTSTQGLKFS